MFLVYDNIINKQIYSPFRTLQNTGEHNPYVSRLRPTWQEFMLLPTWSGEGNDSAPEPVYRRFLDALGIIFNHLTHLRSSAMEQASTWGLDCFRLATMSKHLLDKINRFYMAESNRDVLHMMSGFREENDAYFVPRTHVEIPFLANNEYVSHIFPNYQKWLSEFKSPQGDKNRLAAGNFLYKVLPYLARVVIQDAPYHIKKYPDSEFSRFFVQNVMLKHPEYHEYCSTAIGQAAEIAAARNHQETANLNSAAQ